MRRREFIILAGAAAATWLPPTALRSEERVIKIVALGDALATSYYLPVGRRFSDRLEFASKAKGYSVHRDFGATCRSTTKHGPENREKPAKNWNG